MRHPGPASTVARPAWRWAWIGAFAGGMLGTMAYAPAHWLDAVVRLASGERVQLRDAQGTLWSGSAWLTLAGGPGSRDALSLPSRLRWQVRPFWPGLSLTLSSACCTPEPLHWRVSRENGAWVLQLQDQQSEWPLPLLSGLGAPWNSLEPAGRLLWDSRDMRLLWSDRALRWQGQSTLQVQDLHSRLSPLRPMGQYRLTWQAGPSATAQPALLLQTLQGPLQLSGQGQWDGTRLRFTGEARAEPGFEDSLSNLLNIIGRRDGARSLLSMG